MSKEMARGGRAPPPFCFYLQPDFWGGGVPSRVWPCHLHAPRVLAGSRASPRPLEECRAPPGLGSSELTTVPDCYLTAVPYLPVPYQFWTSSGLVLPYGGGYIWRELTPYHRATSNFRLATFALSDLL